MTTRSLVLNNVSGLHDPAAAGYSHFARIGPGAATLLISGQYGSDQHGAVVSVDFEIQMLKAFDNLLCAIEMAGCTPRNVAKLTVFIVDHADDKLPLLRAALRQNFGEHFPAMTLLPVPRLATRDMLFEVEAIVVVPEETETASDL